MASVFDVSVERPILAASVNLLLIAMGVAAIFTLPIREYPDIDPPTVSVRTEYVGAPSEVVEREVTKIIEDNLSGIEGVRLIQSQSRNESSSINIEFLADTDINAAAADVRDKVSSVRSELPDDVEEPTIEKANADDQPMMWITLKSSELKPPELTDLADRLITDAIGVVPGVARIQIGGEKRYAMRIWLDRQALAARGITPSDVVARLEAENLEAPAGRLETDSQEIVIRAETRFADASEFEALVLRDVGGDRVTLGSVAQVVVGVEEYRTALRADGREAVALGVIRQSNANTLEVAAGVREEIDSIRDSIPTSVSMTVDYDESVFISETLKNVAVTLAQVVGVIVLVTWLFLGSLRATIIPAAAIPASVIPAFLVAATFGFSVNVLSILAVILAISLTTDDAVVIVENIRRRQQDGEPQPIASLRATRQVGFATFASAAALIAVILPLAFIPGNVGRLFREFAVVLAAIVAFSTFAALTLSPMLASRLFRKEDKEPGRVARFVDGRLKRLGEGYRGVLERSVARPLFALVAALVLTAAGAAVFLTIPNEVAPEEDRATLRIQIEAPEGAAFPYTSEKVREVEKVLQKYIPQPGDAAAEERGEEVPDRPIEGLLAIVTPGFGGSLETNIAFIILRLKPWGEREVSQQDLQQSLQRDLGAVTGVSAFATGGPTLGQRRRGQQLQFVVSGVDRADVRGWADTLFEQSSSIEGLQNAELDYKDTKPQLSVTIDRRRAATLGVDAATVGEALQVLFGSLEVTRYTDRGEEYEVIVQGRDQDRQRLQDLQNVYVRSSSSDELIPLSAVVTTKEEGSVRELGRVDRLAAIALESSLAPNLSLGDALTELDAIAEERLPAEAQIGYLGEAPDLRESGGSVYVILILVIVLVYFVLAGQFESFVHPLIVLTSAPMALAGGLITMWAFGLTLNIYTQIALILLVGLVAKNAILLVEFSNQLRTEGREPHEAAVEAASLRLRPILMTSVATILGAVPLILESGAGAEARRTLGLVTSGGLIFGTLLTLFIVPTAYVVLGRFVPEPDKVKKEIEDQARDNPDEGDPDTRDAEPGKPGEPRPEPAR